MAECSVDRCDQPAICKDLCGKHYGRWRRLGTTDDPYPVPAHVLARVEQILATRNIDGKVPLDITCDILDDMARLAGCRTIPQRHNKPLKEAS